MNLETWFQIHTNVTNFEMASPKTIQMLKGELLGKNEVILNVWPWNFVSIFDNFIY